MTICNQKLGQNLSPNGEFFRVKKHLEQVARMYRLSNNVEDKRFLSMELEKYGARNLNTGNGSYVIVF